MKNETRRADEIMDKIDYENKKNQYMVSLTDLEVLISAGAEVVKLNKLVGNCYCHIVEYKGKEFFDITGAQRFFNGSKFLKII